MKKLLLSLLALVTFLVSSAESITTLFGSAGSWPKVQTYTQTITSTDKDNAWAHTNFNNNNNGWAFIKCGNKTAASVGSIYTNVSRPEKIKEVVVTIDAVTTAKVNKAELYISSDKTNWGTAYKTATDVSTGDLTFTIDNPQENLYYKVDFDCQKGSSNGLVQVSKLVLNYDAETPSTKLPAELSFEGEPKYVLTIGENFDSFVAPKLNNPNNLPVTYSVAPSADQGGIATVDSEGNVTLKEEEGNVVVFATFDGDETYEADEVSYAIEVKMPAKKDAGISFGDVTSVSALLGSAFEAPALLNPNNLGVTYSSSNESVATVDNNGAVTIKAAGKTIITAKFAGNEEFESKEVSYTLNVTDPNNLSAEIVAAELGYANAADVTTIDEAPVTISFSKGSNTSNGPKFYTSDNTIRLYANNTVTFSIAEGYYITEIAFTGSPLTLNADKGSYTTSNGTWKGKETSVKFTATDKPKFTKITVKYSVVKKAPELSFGDVTEFEVEENGEFEAPTLINPHDLPVTYSSSDDDVALVDEKTGDVMIGTRGEATITASFAGNNEYEAGEATYKITVKSDKLYCDVPTFSATDILVGQTVTITSNEGATIYYTINGGETIDGLSPLTLPAFTEAGTYEIYAIASMDGHEISDATATITVTVPMVTEEVTFDFKANDYGMTRTSDNNYYNPDNTRFGNGWIVGNANKKTRLWSDGLRVYSSGTVTFEAPKNVIIKSVSAELFTTKGASNGSANFTIKDNTAECSFSATNVFHTVTVTYAGTTEDLEAIAEDFRNSSSQHFTIMVDGVAHTEPVITKTHQSDVKISLAHAYPHAAIYYKWENASAEVEPAGMYYDVIDGFTKHEGDITIPTAGTLSYYAELNGHQTAVQSIGVEGPTTSISEIEVSNGEAQWFDLQGRRVANPSHGLFIVNGKKVIR